MALVEQGRDAPGTAAERDEAREMARSFLKIIGMIEGSDPEYLRVTDWLSAAEPTAAKAMGRE